MVVEAGFEPARPQGVTVLQTVVALQLYRSTKNKNRPLLGGQYFEFNSLSRNLTRRTPARTAKVQIAQR
jgi:hypothetical protein